MEKLVRSDIARVLSTGNVDSLWVRIEAELQAVREETRAELLKDHFKVDEPIQQSNAGGQWESGYLCFQSYYKPPERFWVVYRRPPKMRPLTRLEMKEVALTGLGPSVPHNIVRAVERISDATLLDLLKSMELPTEVEE